LSGRVSIPEPDRDERDAIVGLTGDMRGTGTKRIGVDLGRLDAAVRRATGLGLAELLETIGPKLRDRPAEAAASAVVRTDMLRAAEASPLHESAGWYRDWLAGLGGTLTKLVSQGEKYRLAQCTRVLEHLENRPANAAPIMLPTLAAAVTRDTKALNHGTTLATLVLRALAICAGVPKPTTAEQRRELWDAFDVIVDDLASRVLVLNLPAEGDGLGEWLSGAARHGTPFHVTLHQIVTLPIQVRHPVVFVCENPAVLRQAAGDLGAAAAPLLCTEGRPSTAFHRLARAITDGGGELLYHGDFDWPGIAIAGTVMERHRAKPWRMSSADYLAGRGEHVGHIRLSGQTQPTPWDPELSRTMADTGDAVYEETVADRLIADLGGRGTG
jgi:uncharacterized protein (TIGR02679 family)